MGVGCPGVTIGDIAINLGREEMLRVLGGLLRGVLGLVWRRGMRSWRLLPRLSRMWWRKPGVPSEVGLAKVEAMGVGAGRPQGRHGRRVCGCLCYDSIVTPVYIVSSGHRLRRAAVVVGQVFVVVGTDQGDG